MMLPISVLRFLIIFNLSGRPKYVLPLALCIKRQLRDAMGLPMRNVANQLPTQS